MFVDASALGAILADEDDAEELESRLGAAAVRLTSGLALYEAALAIARILQIDLATSIAKVAAYRELVQLRLVAIGEPEALAALDAFARFGKGRHRAGLNMGDCFAYACARTNGVPLLYKGEDFALTDVVAA